MNQEVQMALENAQQKLQERKQQLRDELALYFKLYTRDYAPDGKFSDTYSFFDSTERPLCYFRKVPQPLTDEEAEALQAMREKMEAAGVQTSAAAKPDADDEKAPVTGIMYHRIGMAILVLALVVLIVSIFSYKGLAVVSLVLPMMMVAIPSAMIFFAISKVLMLLQKIASNTKK